MHDCSSGQALIALENALAHYASLPVLEATTKPLLAANGEVLAAPACAACDLPAFTQSAMDGYALRGEDQSGCLTLVGEVAVYNVDGSFYATDNACTHKQGPLNEGTLDGCLVECPWHGSKFDVRTGQVTLGPAKQPLKTYRVTLDGPVGRVEL